MPNAVAGLHHVTALAGSPQDCADFYTQVLGLRMVKLTVNFDDPETYHLYFADRSGSPGSVLTIFPMPYAVHGRIGAGEVSAVALSVEAGAIGLWRDKLTSAGVECSAPIGRFDDEVLSFRDQDGLPLELINDASGERPWSQIYGFSAVTLAVRRPEKTAAILTNFLGYRRTGAESNRARYQSASAGPASIIDLIESADGERGSPGAGSVHHIAFRARDEAHQSELREGLVGAGYNVTEVRDRSYFKSIYFREPSGVLFEIATDGPGFAIDESLDELGTALKLPPWLESRRGEIARGLPPLVTPR